MRRTEVLQGLRLMKFEDVYGNTHRGELSQSEAAEILGMSERTFRRWRDRYDADGAEGLYDRRLGKVSARRVHGCTGTLRDAGVAISMDGRGRCMDNIFIERLWRSLKYEAVYLHDLSDGFQAERVIGEWIDFYNTESYIPFKNQEHLDSLLNGLRKAGLPDAE